MKSWPQANASPHCILFWPKPTQKLSKFVCLAQISVQKLYEIEFQVSCRPQGLTHNIIIMERARLVQQFNIQTAQNAESQHTDMYM